MLVCHLNYSNDGTMCNTANWRDSVRVRMYFRVGREVVRERE